MSTASAPYDIPTTCSFSVSASAADVPQSRIRAVLLEHENLLYDGSGWERWLHQVLTRFGCAQDYVSEAQVWRKDYLPAICRGEQTWSDALESLLQARGLRPGQIGEVLAAHRGQQRCAEAKLRALPGVIATLAAVAGQGVRTAVLANSPWPEAVVVGQLEKLGIAGRISMLCCSQSVHSSLPDAKMFEVALRRLALEPDQVLFVGSAASHVAAARKLGMPACGFGFVVEDSDESQLATFDDLLAHVKSATPNNSPVVQPHGLQPHESTPPASSTAA